MNQEILSSTPALKRIFSDENGQASFWIGSNYWPAHAGIEMWQNWQPDLIEAELRVMHDLGFNVCRTFLYMPLFMPTALRVETEYIQRMLTFLELCEDAEMGTILSFFVGHMSGEDWDTTWRQDKNFYTDITLRRVQKTYVQTIVNSCQNNSTVKGWILSNEIPNYESRGTASEVTNWARDIINSIREIDSVRPVSIGDGCWSPETSRRLENFRLRDLAPLQDFVGLHFYPRSGNPWHQAFTAAFRIRMAAFWNKPVIIEEFGHSTSTAAEHNQAHYYRSVLYSSLINGAEGALNWCFSDFQLINTRPYNHHPHELRFGIRTCDHRIKAAGEEMRQFATLARKLTEEGWQRMQSAELGLIIPSGYYTRYPYDWDNDFSHWYSLYLDIFSHLRRSNLNPRPLFEPAIELDRDGAVSHIVDLDPEQTPLLMLPRLKRISAPFWEQIKTYVTEGGTIYASFAHDTWVHDWQEFFDLQTDLRFGEPCYPESKDLRLTAEMDWGIVKSGTSWRLPLPNDDLEVAFCPVLQTTGEILWRDSARRPVLVRTQVGKGMAYFSTYPLEYLAFRDNTAAFTPLLRALYRSLWLVHGVPTIFTLTGDDLECGLWKHPASERIISLVLNQAWAERSGNLTIPNHFKPLAPLPTGVEAGDEKISFQLPAKQIAVVEYTPCSATQ